MYYHCLALVRTAEGLTHITRLFSDFQWRLVSVATWERSVRRQGPLKRVSASLHVWQTFL